MKNLSKTIGLVLAGMMATTALSGVAMADTTTKAAATETTAVKETADATKVKPAAAESAVATKDAAKTPAKTAETTTAAKPATDEELIVIDNIQVSGQAKSVLTGVRSARFALFEGQTDIALELTEKAQAAFDKDMADYAIKLDGDKGYAVPLDYSIEFAEDFKPTEDNTAVIAKAGKQAQAGDTTAAVKAMSAAGIDISVKYAFLPAAKTKEKLDKVVADLKEKKFYEANLALKSIETSMLVEDFELSAAPKQGHDVKDIF